MAANLDSVITWKQAVQRFEELHLPVIKQAFEKDGRIDECARSEAWNNFTDYLCKGNEISDWQYANWTHPACCS